MNRVDEAAVRELRRQGLSLRAIGRYLGVHRRAVRTALVASSGLQRRGAGRPRPSLLDPHGVYILAILKARGRLQSDPGPLHVTRRQDLLELTVPEPDLTIYDLDRHEPQEGQP